MITTTNWYDAKNYDRNKEAIRVCQDCGHISELHVSTDYGTTCDGGEYGVTWCSCSKFRCKVVDELIVYEE